jgi:hypothetical protein
MSNGSSEHESQDNGVASLSSELEPASTIQGFIERIEPQRVSGWAWDKKAPEIFLEIEILLDGKILATTRADRFREDLKSGTGDGRHAFQAFFDEPVPEQMMNRISAVARSGPGGVAAPLVNLVRDPQASALAGPIGTSHEAAGAKQWLSQLAAAHRRLQATCTQALEETQEALAAQAATAAEVAETIKSLAAMQEQIAQQLSALEVFQTRFDSTLKRLEERGTAAGTKGRTDRGLRIAVALVATISAASLALGLWSILGG